MRPTQHAAETVRANIIKLADFEISWAGENPWNGGLCFGSEDGRLKTTDLAGNGPPASRVAESGEAINGVAFSGRMMAVSTRSEVVLNDLSRPGDRAGTKTVFDGGAHQVIATAAGGFLAPLGVDGLLVITPEPGPVQTMKVFTLRERMVNLYRLAHLYGKERGDLFTCAARRDGLLVVALDHDGPTSIRNFKAPGLDVVDVCSLGSTNHPFAVACLGADRSLHLSRDVLNGRPPQTLRFDGLRGTPYSLLHAQGHLFLVTSEAVYVFPNLASSYLSGDYGGGPTHVREIPRQVVDASIALDRLLIILSDMVLMTTINEIVAEGKVGGTPTSVVEASRLTETHWDSSPISELTFAAVA